MKEDLNAHQKWLGEVAIKSQKKQEEKKQRLDEFNRLKESGDLPEGISTPEQFFEQYQDIKSKKERVKKIEPQDTEPSCPDGASGGKIKQASAASSSSDQLEKILLRIETAQNKTNFYLRFCAIAAFAIVLYTTINWFMYGHWWFVPMKFTPSY
jgi:hypothetical protein